MASPLFFSNASQVRLVFFISKIFFSAVTYSNPPVICLKICVGNQKINTTKLAKVLIKIGPVKILLLIFANETNDKMRTAIGIKMKSKITNAPCIKGTIVSHNFFYILKGDLR